MRLIRTGVKRLFFWRYKTYKALAKLPEYRRERLNGKDSDNANRLWAIPILIVCSAFAKEQKQPM